MRALRLGAILSALFQLGCAMKLVEIAKVGLSPLAHVGFIDDKLAVAISLRGGTYTSVDGGETWTVASRLDKLVRQVVFYGRERGYLVKDNWSNQHNAFRGQVWMTRDAARTWSLLLPQDEGPDRGRLHSIAFPDEQHGLAVGDRGLLVSTADGGKTWASRTLLPDYKLYAVHFLDTKRGFAAGAQGTILRTTDGGETWEKVKTPVTEPLGVIRFVDAQNGWVAGAAGIVLRTTDGGSTWVQQQTGTTEPLWSMAFRDPLFGFVVGEKGTVLVTKDGGQSWTPLRAISEDRVSSATVDPGGRLLASDFGGRILRAE
jgi:photosystem II stability/assembly factor-like uncharacterized protein